ncbi:hypothetical protein D7Y13_38585 [Corallococcus praedator]|uniref:Uncharacterized protein n=1 Tax=Corallococcus praedator TaxID=2316724 RepID=A0ABX9Q6A1_9BACT|nr:MULTISPECIES: hypothetical protein [Corallococcus]RKH18339.1 hypothetical protein D7X75_39635 [Corallococcus sp. CA031C]RKH91637.1 hypothetical protein D7Y13_38585 [Corallococcus praedator]
MLATLMTVLALTLAAPPSPPDASTATCRSIDGHVSCGYACKSDGQRVRCAQTLQGRCTVIDGQASCFDPPAYVVKAYGAALPESECKTIDGVVGCGYSCVTDFGKVKCARTPAGVCKSQSGNVTCFDPPAAVFAVYGKQVPRAQCVSNGLQMACGFNCVNASEGVRCAKTPVGVCKAQNGSLTCFDPTPAALCAWGKGLPTPQCKLSETGPVCGFNCTTAYGKVACAGTPAGICKVFDSEVYCFDPPAEQQADAACLASVGLAALDGAAP